MRQIVLQRIAGSIVPGLLFLVGLAGIPEDLEQWARWLRASHLPLAVWLLFGGAALACWLGTGRYRD